MASGYYGVLQSKDVLTNEELTYQSLRVVHERAKSFGPEGAGRLPDFEVALFGEHGVGDATAGVLRKRAERAAARVDPDALAGKVAAGRRERCVRVQPGLWPGTTEWHAVAAADRSRRAWEAVCELADEYVKGKPELSEGQARADAFLDLLLRNVQVQTVVTVGVTDATIDAVLRGPLGTALTRAAGAALAPTPFPTPLPKPALPYLPPELHPPFTRSATCTRLFAEPVSYTHLTLPTKRIV